MKTSTDLFELMRSLTKPEKRYFRLFSSLQTGNKNYMDLFNRIEKMKVYDESDLRNRYKRLTFTKQYLYNTIIKSLKAYNANYKSQTLLNEQLVKLKLLYHKSLLKQFYRRLNVMKQKAKELENFNLYHELLKLEIQSIKTGEYKGYDQIKILKEINSVLTTIKNLNEYTLLNMTIREHTRLNGMVRDNESFIKISGVKENPLIKKGYGLSSNREKDSYHRLMSSFTYVTGEMAQMIEHNLIRLETVRNNPQIFEEDLPVRLIEIYGPLLYGTIKLERFDEFKIFFRQLKSVKVNTNMEKATKFSKITMYEFLYYLKTEEFEKGIGRVVNIEQEFKKYEDSMQKDDILIIRYYICRLYFGARRFNEALEYSNNLLNHSYIEYRSDVHSYCRILNLIIHFELGNYELLPYIIKSVYRYLYKYGKVYNFEKTILKFLKTLESSDNQTHLRERLTILRKELLKLNDVPFEKNVFIYLELISWIDKKIKLFDASVA